ncbi:Phosphatidylinositol 4-phosphate 5-kinase 2 (AtPIP5K2) (1-phosphatidylinositol 4-phosphate kinase 2) (Diphosphoinositide kinase 2) (PtdIns(4)P-5-kinase 2) [Durusdinium trenchii]|uniref:Phosphatidylinositol 4-phosphate 5-kinase 2 (AtPIP5K2) (1-phosphatidylinositol 4-phosphate kinase 2) (Diphosphoinositide kinase 2) (PtdIns(4)P-5-kinase 2) n=1 Tax=Durusdinium trenchii TaxID=1381693 RepID=A0ABP0NV99_9DINO
MDEQIFSLLAASASYWIYEPTERSLPFFLQLGPVNLQISCRVRAILEPTREDITQKGTFVASYEDPTTHEQRKVFVLSFRGSRTAADWAANAAVVPDKQKFKEQGLWVQAGWASLVHVDALVEKFLAALQEEDPSSLHAVLLCGHSLGGALAQVTAMLAYQEVLRGRLGSDVARLLSRLRCFTLAAPQPFAVDPQGDAGKALEWMSHAVNYVNNQDWVPRLPGSVEFLEKAAPGCKIDMDLEFLKLFRTVTTTIFLTSRASETLTPAEASQRLAESAPLKLLGGLAEHEVRSYCEQIFTTFGATSHLFGHGASSWTSSGYDGGSKGMGTSRCGAYKSKEGSCYEGQWKDGLPEGLGVLKWPNGSYFQGEWRAGKRNGQGLLIYPDGSSFTGEWKDDQRNGSGVRKYPDGSLFKGEWKEDQKTGLGLLTWPDGSTVHGEW